MVILREMSTLELYNCTLTFHCGPCIYYSQVFNNVLTSIHDSCIHSSHAASSQNLAAMY